MKAIIIIFFSLLLLVVGVNVYINRLAVEKLLPDVAMSPAFHSNQIKVMMNSLEGTLGKGRLLLTVYYDETELANALIDWNRCSWLTTVCFVSDIFSYQGRLLATVDGQVVLGVKTMTLADVRIILEEQTVWQNLIGSMEVIVHEATSSYAFNRWQSLQYLDISQSTLSVILPSLGDKPIEQGHVSLYKVAKNAPLQASYRSEVFNIQAVAEPEGDFLLMLKAAKKPDSLYPFVSFFLSNNNDYRYQGNWRELLATQ